MNVVRVPGAGPSLLVLLVLASSLQVAVTSSCEARTEGAVSARSSDRPETSSRGVGGWQCRFGWSGGGSGGSAHSLPLTRHAARGAEAFDNRLDPSGSWTSRMGSLALMHDANRLSFAYLAVFGSAAHICEGAGVAGLVGRDRYEYVDESGTVAFVLRDRGVKMLPVEGVPAFCGSGWPGDTFAIEEYEPPLRCEVSSERSAFRVVDHLLPERRPVHVCRGESIDVVVTALTGAEPLVLARGTALEGRTVGLLPERDVTCP